MSVSQTALSSNNYFYKNIGFSSEEDLKSINRYFYVEKRNILKNIYLGIEVKINRIIHLLKTGVWINSHMIGQTLNQYRFREGTSQETIEHIESIFNKSISSNFIQKAYESATEETTLESLENSLSFFFQFIKSPTTVGSLLPSSKKLSKEIVNQISGAEISGSTRRYIEVGPGTGTFTKELIKKLRDEDQLDLVEFDEKFVNVLRKRFGHIKNVKIIQGDFTKFTSIDQYDYCVSGLPLAAFDKKMVEKIYHVFDSVVKKGGTVAYFEYIGLPHLKKAALSGEDRKNFERVLKLKEKYYCDHNGTSENIWLNVTPARVCRVIV